MIKQRCKTCRRFIPIGQKTCLCGAPQKENNFYSIKHIDRKRFKLALGDITRLEATQKDLSWNPYERVQPSTTYIENVRDTFITKLEGEGSAYINESKLFLNRLIAFMGGKSSRTQDVTTQKARAFQSHLILSHSPAYTDRHIAMLRAAWNYCIPDDPNPWKKVKFYRPDNKLIRFLTPDQEDALVNASMRFPVAHAMILIALNTGLRANEIMTLTKDMVFLDARIIRGTGKGKKQFIAPVNQNIYPILEDLCNRAGSNYLFPSPSDSAVPYTSIRKTWTKIKDIAGIKDFRFHDLRHHFAIKIGRLTNDIHLVKDLLNHSDISVTINHYRHFVDTEKLAAVDRLVPRTHTTPEEITENMVN